MANLPISGLPPAGPLDGSELLAVVQGGVTDKSTIADIATFIDTVGGLWTQGTNLIHNTKLTNGVFIGQDTAPSLPVGAGNVFMIGGKTTRVPVLLMQSDDLVAHNPFGAGNVNYNYIMVPEQGNQVAGGVQQIGITSTSFDVPAFSWLSYLADPTGSAPAYSFQGSKWDTGGGAYVNMPQSSLLARFSNGGGASSFNIYGNGSLQIGAGVSSRLDTWLSFVNSGGTIKGFAPPAGTTSARGSIPFPTQGILYDNTQTNALQRYNGATWDDIAVGTVMNFWQQNSGYLAPLTITDSVSIGVATPSNAYAQTFNIERTYAASILANGQTLSFENIVTVNFDAPTTDVIKNTETILNLTGANSSPAAISQNTGIVNSTSSTQSLLYSQGIYYESNSATAVASVVNVLDLSFLLSDGSVSDGRSIHIATPSMSGTGNIGRLTGLLIDDLAATGVSAKFAIRQDGRNDIMRWTGDHFLTDPLFTNPILSAQDTSMYGFIGESAGDIGLNIVGYADGTAINPMNIQAISTTNTVTNALYQITGAKNDGVGNRGNLDNSDVLVDFTNNFNPFFRIMGNGSTYIGDVSPTFAYNQFFNVETTFLSSAAPAAQTEMVIERASFTLDADFTSGFVAHDTHIDVTGSHDASVIAALNFEVDNGSTGTTSYAAGIFGLYQHNAAGTTTIADAIGGELNATSGAVITMGATLHAYSPYTNAGAGTMATAVGCQIDAQKVTGVTIGYGVKQDGTSDLNTFLGSVGIGANPNAVTALDVSSTTKGLRVPRQTTAQRTAITTTNLPGIIVYDTDIDGLFYTNNAGNWVQA